ncbi:MAG: rhomboid family intramembrane serine protease [Pirellulaceae bacterium]|nr:rhomboid family intramembrane serine protease [Pirellulaceae bacterium]
MRRIGSLSNGAHANRFCDYLVTLSIDAVAENASTEGDSAAGDSQWDIWIRDEADVGQARSEFAAFQKSPDDVKYQVTDAADKIRDDLVAKQQRRIKQQRIESKAMASRSGGGAFGGSFGGVGMKQQNIPITIAIIALSIICSFASNFGRPRPSRTAGQLSLEEKTYSALSFVSWRDYVQSGSDPFASIKKGEAWRFITPMFLHGSTMHLAFNMMGVFFLGTAIERLQGSLFFGVLVFATHFVGMAVQVLLPGAESLPEILQGLAGSPFAIGASGAVYGLFGYVWVRPSLDPFYPIRMVPMNVAVMIGWLVLCIFAVDHIANGAHIGGLIAGMIAAVITVTVIKSGKA